MYRFTYLCLPFLVLQLNAQSTIDIDSTIRTCAEQFDLDYNTTKRFFNRDDTQEDSQTYGEFMLCVFNKGGVIDESRKMDRHMITPFYTDLVLMVSDHDTISKSIVQEASETCIFEINLQQIEKEDAIKYKNCIIRILGESLKKSEYLISTEN